MNLNIQQIICLAIIIISVIGSVRRVMYTEDLGEAIEPIISGCSTIITFFIMLGYYEEIDLMITNILRRVFENSIKDNGLVHIGGLVLIFVLVKYIIHIIFRFLHSFSFNNAINKLNRNRPFLLIFSVVFGVIRGLVVIILVSIPLVLYNSLAGSNNRINIFDGIKPYDKMEQIVDSKKVKNISNGLLENVSSSKVVYYNGVTLDEGVKSNEEIKNKAIEITKRGNSDREKAESIYKWVGSNIKYDDDKAEKVMNSETGYESGAISAFKTRTGICFDYACLYTAMAKEIGIKTRIVVGDAFNGNEYVSHAWNEVYLEDEGRWINVDPTFYIAGDYFDNANFEDEHRKKSVAGEF
ncbi:transglutaminase domain-containing protein [Clostridium paraputrificum]|uniref:transglutaminase domain-containing protein n=1 Tax=Clostridium TaxID=1485 RepID=UPI003D331EA0